MPAQLHALPNGGWCGPGRPHFDMSQPAWEHIGVYQAGIVPVLYQRVQCTRTGGVRFSMAGSNYFLLVNIQNLGGSGSVAAAWVKGDNTGWIQMSRNWGANWQALAGLVGQGLSFAVTSPGGQYIQFLNVVPAWWQFGMAFSTNQNFVYKLKKHASVGVVDVLRLLLRFTRNSDCVLLIFDGAICTRRRLFNIADNTLCICS